MHTQLNLLSEERPANRSASQDCEKDWMTPRECERLQGFPDDYTQVTFRGKPASDAPRYKALGNSMAVPVMRWIGERIITVEETLKRAKAQKENA